MIGGQYGTAKGMITDYTWGAMLWKQYPQLFDFRNTLNLMLEEQRFFSL